MIRPQLHRPQVGEWFVAASGRQIQIEAVHYETRREVFRVTYPDGDAIQGRRGCLVMRDGAGWCEFDAERYQPYGEQVIR